MHDRWSVVIGAGLTDVAYKISAGVLGGWATTWFLFRLPFRHRFVRTRTGFVALAMTLLVYGMTELAEGYGFLAAFIAPLMMRHLEADSDFHDELYDYAEESEQMLRVTVLFLFGGAISYGLLASLTWPAAAVGLAFLLLVRPILAMKPVAICPAL